MKATHLHTQFRGVRKARFVLKTLRQEFFVYTPNTKNRWYCESAVFLRQGLAVAAFFVLQADVRPARLRKALLEQRLYKYSVAFRQAFFLQAGGAV